MQFEDIENRLIVLLQERQADETTKYEIGLREAEAKKALEDARAKAFAGGLISGTNETSREAQYRSSCAEQYNVLNAIQLELMEVTHRINLNTIQVSFLERILRVQEDIQNVTMRK